ncbi:MAG: ATP-dependent helicase, partial [Anaerolineaceae bacterium]
MAQFTPRPAQKRILEYTQGLMGIKAVPGSGKTHTLSYLASRLLLSDLIREDQEILIVTLVNSAVENFATRIAGFIREYGLLPNTGYRVRTLHGLAHEIVRERPTLVGLSDEFQILDERESSLILNNIVSNWVHVHPEFIDLYTHPDQNPSHNFNLIKNFELTLVDTATSFIRKAKDEQQTPDSLRGMLESLGASHELLDFGISIYEEYHRALHYRSAIDFDDLIRLALQALETDEDYLNRLRERWPYILEDEAQDSSRLQERILSKLAGPNGNWVRVGDPNQAIFETFTTAHPRYLLNFIERPDVISAELPNSGRSTASIIRLANHLITWSRSEENPNPDLHDTLTLPLIEPAPPNDPQPNPPDRPERIFLYQQALEPEKELQLVAGSLAKWLPENPDKTAAILVPRNERGVKMVDALKSHQIEPVELLRSSLSTRQTADILASILLHLAEPNVRRHLTEMYRKISAFEENPDKEAIVPKAAQVLRDCPYPEQLLWPQN